MFLRQAECALNRRGFTLVELLLAASLFLVATTAFGYLLRVGKTAVGSASKFNQSVYAIQARMEEVKRLPFDQLISLDGSTFAQGMGKVSAIPLSADLVSIQLELKWAPKKIPLNLYTLRSKY